MNKPTNGKNIFADKATFIIRKMLSNPEKKWVTGGRQSITFRILISFPIAAGV